MNFRDPELVLVKKYRGNERSYFQVYYANQDEVSLQDIVHGSRYIFQRKVIESHIKQGILKITAKNEIPSAIFVALGKKKSKPVSDGRKAELEEVVELRYQYVRAVMASDLPSLSENRLIPWIEEKAVELGDNVPPCPKTLYRWVKAFNESGWKRSALIPGHSRKGNKTVKLNAEVDRMLKEVIAEHCKASARVNVSRAHRDYVNRIEALNQERESQGLPLLKAGSYQATLKRFRGK